jgi:hypothetical protein
MKRPDLASGLALAGVGIFVIQQSRQLTYQDEFGPGPGLLPLWLGVLLTALAFGQAAAALRRPGGQPPVSTSSEADANQSRPRRLLLTLAGLALTAGLLEWLGFIVSFALLAFFLVYMVERRSFTQAVTVALVMSLAFLLVFRVIVPIPLPLNAWGF